MADSIEFSLTGMDELLGKLDELKVDVRNKGGRFALRKAANLVAEKAKANAARVDDPTSPERIADNIAVRFSNRTYKASGDLKFRVGVMGGAGGGKKGSRADLPGGDTRHWRMLEFGTSRMAAKPFMRKSLSDNLAAAIDEFARQYSRAIDRALRRAQKKTS